MQQVEEVSTLLSYALFVKPQVRLLLGLGELPKEGGGCTGRERGRSGTVKILVYRVGGSLGTAGCSVYQEGHSIHSGL